MVARTDILPEELTESQQLVVEEVFSRFFPYSSSLTENINRHRRPRPAKDIEDFIELAGTVIKEQQELDGLDENLRIELVHDFVPQELTTEVITFGLLSRVPGSISRGAPFNKRVQEYKPHIRAIEDDIAHPGQKIITLGQIFENEIVLTCWAKTNKTANSRARWLEDTLRNWTWFIRYQGIEDFFFLGQDADITISLDGTSQKIVGRPLRYYVRTQRESTVFEPVIRHVVIKYRLGLE